MKTKQEVIQIFNSIGWNEIEYNHYVSPCGTYSIDFENYSFADTNGGILTFNNYEELLERSTNNNGWTRIERESDLPKNENELFETGFMDDSGKFRQERKRHSLKTMKWLFQRKMITHYHPVIIPKPPIF